MSEQDQESPAPWRFVRLDQFSLPPEPTREKMRRGLLGFWDRLTGTGSASESPAVEKELEQVPSLLLEQAAPPPDWGEGVPALHAALQDWWQERAGKIQVLVGAPYSGNREIAAQWAAAQQCPVLSDPPVEHIKSGGAPWLKQIDQDPDRVWVIPRLERFYLRHSQGFAMLRVLLDKITASSTRFLLTCDSWAWAYLSKALHIDALFPAPLVLEAFNQEKLDRWLAGLASRAPEEAFVFRQTDNGNLVLHPAAAAPGGGEESKNAKITNFLQHLAAFSRGIPGVAHTIWRYSLRIAQTKENQEKPQEVADDDGRHRTIWVEPLSQLNLPSPSKLGSRDRELFILHTLLLHGGLSSRVLADILPFSESQIISLLQALRVAGIVVSDQDTWRVAASAYPASRQFLQYEGYLVDAL
jgi:hypothetical protein